jgi:hypothetical protein
MGEVGAGAATLAEIDADGTVRLTAHRVAEVEMIRLDADMSGAEDWDAAGAAMEAALRAARDGSDTPHLVTRLRLTGAGAMTWALRRDPDRAAEEARGRAARLDGTWLEKLEIDCTAPVSAGGGGPIDAFADLISGDIAHAADFRADAREMARDLLTRLPKDLRDRMLGADQAAEDAALDALISDGALSIVARLRAGREGG